MNRGTPSSVAEGGGSAPRVAFKELEPTMANGNGNGRRKSRKRLVLGLVGVVLLAVFGLVAARRGGKEIDPSWPPARSSP